MKKLLMIIIVILFLSGCGNNNLVCTRRENNKGSNVSEKYETSFDGDKIETVIWTSTTTVTGTSIDINTVITSAEQISTIFNGLEGVTSSVEARGNRVTVTTTLNVFEMDDADIIRLSLFLERDTYKELKVDSGFTCK